MPCELPDNDCNLNLPRHVDTFEEEAEFNLGTVKQEIVTPGSQLTSVRTKMEGGLKELGI